MKKQYLKPELEVFDFEVEQMVAASPVDDSKDNMGWEENEEDDAGTKKFKHDWGSTKW